MPPEDYGGSSFREYLPIKNSNSKDRYLSGEECCFWNGVPIGKGVTEKGIYSGILQGAAA